MLDRVDAQPASLTGIDPALLPRLLGRFGQNAPDLVECAQEGELAAIHGLPALWAELRWAARSEAVVRLEDLLVRRVRLAHTLAGGGLTDMERIRSIAQPELGWDDRRWEEEDLAYRTAWRAQFSPPCISGAARDRQ
jgi:glycerol-3-phosphate dehydrogenase